MMFLGSFLSDATSLDATPLAYGTTEYISIENGVYDEVQMDSDVTAENDTDIPEWGYTTILNAKFKNNILAGNVDFTLASISDLVIKKRKQGDYKWTTIHKVPIETEDDFNFFQNDIVVASQTTYEYVAVPIVNDVEGTQQTIDVDVDFEGAFIIDPTMGYQVILNLARESLTRPLPTSVLEPVNCKYPYINHYSKIQYDKFSVTGTFIELDASNCVWNVQDGWRYRKALRDFISNQHAKIVKFYNGEIHMACAVDQISEAPDSHPDNIITTISFVECGDVESNSDLYYHGFTNFLEVIG